MYICKYFSIQEIVPKELFELFKDNHQILWGLFDPNLLQGIDWLRERFGPAYMNTWHLSKHVQSVYGVRNWSGIRTYGSPYYRARSAHSRGMAGDMLFVNHSAEEIRQQLKKMEKVPFIKRVENDVSWLHVDTFTKPDYNGLYFFNP